VGHKIFVDGQEGTTGLKIRERLEKRADLELLLIDETERKDLGARLDMIRRADISFLCLPDAASREIAAEADPGSRILDTSSAHRTAEGWVYGFPELAEAQGRNIGEAKRVAVPGCHATGFVALVKPLIARNLADRDYPFTCHSITGYSGGGKSMIAQYEKECREHSLDSPRQYGLAQNHKHLPEMRHMTGLDGPPAFFPIVAPYYSGMLVTVPLCRQRMKRRLSLPELRREYEAHYQGRTLIRVMSERESPADGFMAAGALAGTDGLEIHILGGDGQFTLMARFDNLGKGASGAAIQCMNLMLGLPEETSLKI
jgi:N-acetyl-gamma-glutamyl-phosphate reductase